MIDDLFGRQIKKSLVGPLLLIATKSELLAISFGLEPIRFEDGELLHVDFKSPNAVLDAAVTQLQEYFAGKRQTFDLPLDISHMTSFQQRVLQAATEIPYGKTVTYKYLAEKCGSPLAFRAVGATMAANPIPIIIPCHRVLGSSNKLHGYAGPEGIKTKAKLLELEGAAYVA